MAPRKTTDMDSNTEDTFSDADFDQWESISDDMGTKVPWDKIGNSITGRYRGTKDIEQENGDIAPAAIFDGTDGVKYWCWIPYAIADVIKQGTMKEGDLVRIVYTSEAETGRNLNPVKKFDIRVKR